MTRLDLLLTAAHPGLSRRKAREVIEKGQVLVEGVAVLEPGRSVEPSAVVTWDAHRKALPRARLSLPKLYEDEHLIVVDKPAGLLSVPTSADAAGTEDTVLARVSAYVRHLRPRAAYVGRVHRLDRETSGALVVALTPSARAGLIRLFRAHDIQRAYLALVAGVPPKDAGTVELPITDTWLRGRRSVAHAEQDSSPARTRWRVIERFDRAALLEVELDTGRQHQIRLHLAHIGLPIVGDRVYGRDARLPGIAAARPMLHARRLAFVHPVTGAQVSAVSPLPEDFDQLLGSLRRRARRGTPSGARSRPR